MDALFCGSSKVARCFERSFKLETVDACLLRSPYNNPLCVYLLFYGGATTDTYCPNSVVWSAREAKKWRHLYYTICPLGGATLKKIVI